MESKSKKNSLAIIIPMYNEEKVAKNCIDAVMKVTSQMKIRTKLIIINDGSKDKTSSILEEKRKKYTKQLIILTHKMNQGYGAAVQSGSKKAIQLGFDWVLHMDSDLTNDPKYIHSFAKYAYGKYDCIKASRYIKGSSIINVPQYRKLISRVGNYIASALFNIGIKDCTNGFRMVRLKLLNKVKFREKNFSIILEELYYLKKNNAAFIEIPYTLTARTSSVSHFSYKPKTFYDYFKYLIKAVFI